MSQSEVVSQLQEFKEEEAGHVAKDEEEKKKED